MAQPHMSQGNDSNSGIEEIVGLELEILRALCTSPQPAEECDQLLRELSSYDWRDPEHRVVYEALLRTRGRIGGALQSEIAATATRMGFPDVEWGEYFGRGGILQVAEVGSRIRGLIAASARLPR